MMQFDRIFLTI